MFAFLRLSIGILVFTIFFAVIKALKDTGKPPFSYFERNQQLTIAFIMAVISVVFMPASVLAATGTVWGTVVSLVLVGGPIFGIGYFLVTYDNTNPSRGTYVLKAVMALLLLWIISAIKFHVGSF